MLKNLINFLIDFTLILLLKIVDRGKPYPQDADDY